MRDVTTSPTAPSGSSLPGVSKLFPQYPLVSHSRRPALIRENDKISPNASSTSSANTNGTAKAPGNVNPGAYTNTNGSTSTAACGQSSSPIHAAWRDKADEGGAKQRTKRSGSASPPFCAMSRIQTSRSNKYLLGRRSVNDLRGRRPSIHTRPGTDEPTEKASSEMMGGTYFIFTQHSQNEC